MSGWRVNRKKLLYSMGAILIVISVFSLVYGLHRTPKTTESSQIINSSKTPVRKEVTPNQETQSALAQNSTVQNSVPQKGTAQTSVPQKETAQNSAPQKGTVQTSEPKKETVRTNVAQQGSAQKETTRNAPVQQAKLTIKDFPSPVKGLKLRTVGNYYSDSMKTYFFHAGTDYAEPEGAVIRCTHGGKVIFAGADPMLGQKVTLDCGQGWQITYGCLENLQVHLGDEIESNSIIGQVGFDPGADSETGQSQLHYEIWHNNEAQSL